jgi:hypothetical protein
MFINWNYLKNPIYSHWGWSVKDACMEYRDGNFYLFFSAFYRDRGKERSHVVGIKTKDFKRYSDPLFILDGSADGCTGLCSPDIASNPKSKKYYLTFNSWGDKHPNGKKNALFYMESEDLEHWSEIRPVATNLTEGMRSIDISIAFYKDIIYLIWKGVRKTGLAGKYQTYVASAKTLDEDFNLIGDGIPIFELQDQQKSTKTQENYHFIEINGVWHLLTTDYPDHGPYLYRMKGDPSNAESWLYWSNGYRLNIPKERFNRGQVCNAAYIIDWTPYDGYYYLLYAGRTIRFTHAGRGNNKLALARSKNLFEWYVPPYAENT